jgi:hypothetical protein
LFDNTFISSFCFFFFKTKTLPNNLKLKTPKYSKLL